MSSPLSRLLPWGALGLAFATTTGLELALVERKYAIFGGGFGSSQVVDTASELALFAAGLVAAQALLTGFLFLAIRALHRKTRQSPLFLLNFLFFAGGGSAALLAAKFEVLSYFSDAIGFGLIRSLGGGSLADAALFVLDDAALMLVGAAAAVAGWWAALKLARRRLPERAETRALLWRHLAWPALALPVAALAAAGEPDARYALTRFNAFALANQALAQATDFDRDGYGWFTAQRDRHPFDPARHPFALDVPNNGVDEDGLAGDFRLAGAPPPPAAAKLAANRKHLVLIVLESVRGDAIGKVVDGRAATPVLNALAREGTWVREAYSHVGFTTASLKSLFAGTLDPAPGDPSLFRDLKANGYRIGILSGQPESFGDISEVVGMKASAEIFVDAETLKAERAFGFAAKGSLLIDGRKLLRELDRRFGRRADWARPAFLYLNFQEAHFPYSHPETMRILPGEPVERGDIAHENRAAVERTYWNAVAYDDWLVGQVVARLKRLGIWDETLLVVTADHGESLFDDGFLGHGHFINRQQTHVPLVLSAAGIEAAEPVGLADYRALLLRALGADMPAPAAGPVFQHIGPLDSPTAIGMVESGGVWTVMTLETGEVRFSDTGRRGRYRQLGGAEKARADRLAALWARERWRARR
jgi:phosphoglycerol transferase MdoB-like AlkP superfamily enzyme